MTTSVISGSEPRMSLNSRSSHGDGDGDATEQVHILLESLKILASLAAMMPSDYQASFQTSQNAKTSSSTVSVFDLQKSLEDLQRGWRLEDTHAVQLCTSIHRLHSTVNNLQKDAEEHAALYATSNLQLVESQQRNAKLERALLRLNAKNQALSQKVKQRSCEKRSLVKHVQDYVQQVQESKQEQKQLEEQNVAFQLHAHHQFLQVQHSPGRCRSFSHDVLTAYPPPQAVMLRSRGMSHDTNFSDLDALDFAASDGTLTTHGILDEEIGLGDDDDNMSCYSAALCSVSSLVTNEGVATLRLSRDNKESLDLAPPPETRQREAARSRTNSRDMESAFGKVFMGATWSSTKAKELPIVDLCFPNASAIGLQFKKLPGDAPFVEKELPKPRGTLTEAMLSSDSSDGSASSLPLANGSSSTSEDKDNDSDDQKQKLGFQLNWNVFGSSSGKSSTNRQDEDTVAIGTFAVSGFEGFHDELNERPSIGERLLSINGETVDGTWSLTELQEHIVQVANSRIGAHQCAGESSDAATRNEEKKSAESEITGITLSFRKDPITRKEKEVLDKASNEQKEYYEDEWGLPCKKPSKDSVNNSGKQSSSLSFNFLNMGPGRKDNTSKASTTAAPHDKKSKQEGSKLSLISKMPTFFPKGNKVATSAASDPNWEQSKIDESPRDKEEEEIQLSSSSSSEDSTPPLFNGASEEEADEQHPDRVCNHYADSKDAKEDELDDNAKPSSASKLLSFFSPQKVLGNQAPADPSKETDHSETDDLTKSESCAPLPPEGRDCSTAVDPSQLITDGATEETGDCSAASGVPDDAKDIDESTTGDKFRDSVKNMGKVFSRPFG